MELQRLGLKRCLLSFVVDLRLVIIPRYITATDEKSRRQCNDLKHSCLELHRSFSLSHKQLGIRLKRL
jgi:hypothetical protein